MNITTNLDGEQVTILNVTGNETSQSIVYIDSSNNIKVKNKPLDWSRKSTFATSAISMNLNIVSSVSGLSGISGKDGQRIICFDPSFPSNGVEFEWNSSTSLWLPMKGQYLIDVGPTSAQPYVYQISAASTSTIRQKIGTIPGNLITTGRLIYADAIVETSTSSSSFLTIGFNMTNLPVGTSFATTAASTRVYSRDGGPLVNVEGSQIFGSFLRQLGSGGSTSTISVDLTNNVDVYVVISSPVVGVVYTIRRGYVKVGGE